MLKQLHITNGDDLTTNITELDLAGDFVVWREMLCEGPTTTLLDSKEFLEMREKFLSSTYNISPQEYRTQFIEELQKLTVSNRYDEVVLWFEFDLFSHINMLAVISHLIENKKNMPIYLVCSKKLKGDKEFFPLSQLPLKNLKNHFDQRIPLNLDDLETANLMWQLYNGDNPQKLIVQIKKKTNFEYLSSCIRAHVERFPSSITGINSLELNILKLINTNNITCMNQLMGYALQYQGYFGLGDIQIERVIKSLEMFYKVEEDKIILTPDGVEALNATKNFYRELKTGEYLGGVKKYDFLYDAETHKLLKL